MQASNRPDDAIFRIRTATGRQATVKLHRRKRPYERRLAKKKPTALIIDDEIHMRQMLLKWRSRETVMRSRRRRHGEPEGINQAIQMPARHQSLLDLGLPDMDGMEVLEASAQMERMRRSSCVTVPRR